MAAESVTKSHLQTPADDGLLRAVFRQLLTLHFLVYKLGYIGNIDFIMIGVWRTRLSINEVIKRINYLR